jgi:hypothetical protein
MLEMPVIGSILNIGLYDVSGYHKGNKISANAWSYGFDPTSTTNADCIGLNIRNASE